MRKIILLLACIGFSINFYPQGASAVSIITNDQKNTNCDSLYHLLVDQQKEMSSSIDTIKTNTKPAIVTEFIQTKFLEGLYDYLFGKDDGNTGIIPFIISLAGISIGVARILWMLIKFKAITGSKSQKIKNIIITSLLVLVSFLMLILTNRNYDKPEAVALNKIYERLEIINRQLNTIPIAGNDNTTVSNNEALSKQINNLNTNLAKIKHAIDESEKKTSQNIENKSAHGALIFFNTLILITIGGMILRKNLNIL